MSGSVSDLLELPRYSPSLLVAAPMATAGAGPNRQTLALLTPRRLVRTVKSHLEAGGIWAKRIEPIANSLDVAGSGLGLGEEIYLVYSTVSWGGDDSAEEDAAADDDDADDDDADAGGNDDKPDKPRNNSGVGPVVVDEILGTQIAVLVREGHVQAEWVAEDAAAASPSPSPSSTATRLHRTIRAFLDEHPPLDLAALSLADAADARTKPAHELLVSTIPKRWSYYPPLVLLPHTAFSSPQWKQYLSALPEAVRTQLYTLFTTTVHPKATHLAINAPIPPTTNGLSTSPSTSNIIRSPTNLIPLHGTFGPHPPCLPTPPILAQTLFVTTTQLTLHQTWAPLHTMFSRGNISEKSRILSRRFPGHTAIPGGVIVDLYAGIGYFTFCYLRAGARLVLAWELNPWSVEGLRRGVEANGFGSVVVVAQGEPTPTIDLGLDLDPDAPSPSPPRVLVFNEDNRHAWRRLQDLKAMLPPEKQAAGLRVRHVNLGLLPTSQGGWETAVRALTDGHGEGGGGRTGWAHVHENAATEEIEGKGAGVVEEFEKLAREVVGEEGEGVGVQVEVEVVLAEEPFRVKTYAPGVVHMVYDIKISR